MNMMRKTPLSVKQQKKEQAEEKTAMQIAFEKAMAAKKNQ